MRRRLVIAVLFVLALAAGAAVSATESGEPLAAAPGLRGHSLRIGPAVRQRLRPRSARRPQLIFLPRPEFEVPRTGRRRSAAALRPRQLSQTATLPVIGFSQEGISRTQGYRAWDPADVSLGVGPTYLGEAVNAAVGWWRIGAGFDTSKVRSLGDFFSTSAVDRRNDQMSDPRLLYDPGSGRWFFIAFDVSRTETDIAVSTSSDPNQSWWIYALAAAGCPDQPRIAVSDTMVALTYNLFESCASRVPPYIGGVVELFDKSAMLSGGVPQSSSYGPDPRFISITPASSFDGGSTIYMVSTDYLFSTAILYTATNVGAASVPFQRVALNLLQKDPPPLQQGSNVPLDPGDSRVQDAFIFGGNIWFAANDGCTPQGAAILQGCIRYVELSESGRVLDQREEALANGRSAFYPAIRPDGNGNIFSVYGYSSSSDYPSLAATIDPGHASGYVELKGGQGVNESGRWGDYFSAARDPNDPSRVWVAGAYGTGGSWNTFIAALSTSPFSIPNPTPPPASGGGGNGDTGASGSSGGASSDTTAPTVTAVPSSGHAGATVRLRYRLSDDSGRSRETIRIRHLGQLIATINTTLSPITNGKLYYATWRAPRTVPASATFCVVAYDPSGNASAPSCAPLRLSGGR